MSSVGRTDLSLVSPVVRRGLGQGELDEPRHLTVTVVIPVHQLRDEVAFEGDQKSLKILIASI